MDNILIIAFIAILSVAGSIYVIFEMPYFFNAIKEMEIKVVYS